MPSTVQSATNGWFLQSSNEKHIGLYGILKLLEIRGEFPNMKQTKTKKKKKPRETRAEMENGKNGLPSSYGATMEPVHRRPGSGWSQAAANALETSETSSVCGSAPSISFSARLNPQPGGNNLSGATCSETAAASLQGSLFCCCSPPSQLDFLPVRPVRVTQSVNRMELYAHWILLEFRGN